MFDEVDFFEKLGNALQGQPGTVGQIGWGLLAILGVYKVLSAVGAGTMNWGEAGKKLEEMFKNFQWRFENEGKGDGEGRGIKVMGLDGSTIYSYANGEFWIDSGKQYNNVTTLLSKREKKRLAKLRKKTVASLTKTHKENSEAALSAQVEKFLQPVARTESVKTMIGRPLADAARAARCDQAKTPVKPVEVKMPEFKASCNEPQAKQVEFKSPELPKIPEAPKLVQEASKITIPTTDMMKEVFAALLESQKTVAKPEVKIEPKQVVTACPNCRITRALVNEGKPAPKCPECKIGDKNLAPTLIETTSDPKEFLNILTSPGVKTGSVFKNYSNSSNKNLFTAVALNMTVESVWQVKKQPSNSFKDQATVAAYAQMNKKPAAPVVDAKTMFKGEEAKPQTIFVQIPEPVKPVVAPAPKPAEAPKPVEVVKPVEVKKSDYTVYCCPKCRTTRAIVRNGSNVTPTCKNEDCKGEKLVPTTGNPEEFVLESGVKVTDYLKNSGLNVVRFKNYGSEKGDKFVAVLLPMTKAPIHNGVKMVAKKQPSDSIVGYVKKEKPVAVKTVNATSKIKVSYSGTVGGDNQANWDFAGKEGSVTWSNVREMMKGMKSGEERIIPACNSNGALNSQFKVKVVEIA